jgi:acetylornithine deacetylase/succinyl-diaminopimelate desuccinylase-like protein
MPHQTDAYIEQNRERFLAELFTLLRQPSISTRNEGVTECANLLASQMRDVGITTEIIPTPRHPVVYGELPKPGAPTVLIYGHYDVQPPEPLELWDSPPFEPAIRNGKIYGRGTSDNKAQLFTYLKTVETMKAVFGELPISLKFLYEGEEEIGSPNQPQAILRAEQGETRSTPHLLFGQPHPRIRPADPDPRAERHGLCGADRARHARGSALDACDLGAECGVASGARARDPEGCGQPHPDPRLL